MGAPGDLRHHAAVQAVDGHLAVDAVGKGGKPSVLRDPQDADGRFVAGTFDSENVHDDFLSVIFSPGDPGGNGQKKKCPAGQRRGGVRNSGQGGRDRADKTSGTGMPGDGRAIPQTAQWRLAGS